jgi:hypothetical protein
VIDLKEEPVNVAATADNSSDPIGSYVLYIGVVCGRGVLATFGGNTCSSTGELLAQKQPVRYVWLKPERPPLDGVVRRICDGSASVGAVRGAGAAVDRARNASARLASEPLRASDYVLDGTLSVDKIVQGTDPNYFTAQLAVDLKEKPLNVADAATDSSDRKGSYVLYIGVVCDSGELATFRANTYSSTGELLDQRQPGRYVWIKPDAPPLEGVVRRICDGN